MKSRDLNNKRPLIINVICGYAIVLFIISLYVEKISKITQNSPIMNKKIWFLLFAISAFFITAAYPQAKDGIKKVVIDAGHGGKDAGAIGSKGKEKDVTLAVALEVGKRIKEKCPDVEVYYTRTADTYPKLEERSKFANSKHADLFISIHCNSNTNHAAHGVETYVMGLHKTESNLAVARRENASMLLEDDYKTTYGNFDPNSPESYIIFSLYSNAYLDRSAKLAAKVQNNLVKTTGFTDRKVQQAGFWVLHSVAMPSILIELGFISNPEEEAKLLNADFQKKLAESIASAFEAYKNEAENKAPANTDKDKNNAEQQPAAENKPAEEQKPADNTKPAEPQKPAEDLKPVENQKPTSNVNDAGVRYKVQFYASKENLSTNHQKFAGLQKVGKYFENNLWKYTSGDELTYESVQKILKSVKEKFPDAFVIAFKDGNKIPLADARKLQP